MSLLLSDVGLIRPGFSTAIPIAIDAHHFDVVCRMSGWIVRGNRRKTWYGHAL